MHLRWSLAIFVPFLAAAMACGGGTLAPASSATPSSMPGVLPSPTVQPTSTPRSGPQAEQTGVLAIVNGTLIDGTGADPVPNAYVIVRDGRVAEMGTGQPLALPPDATVIDAKGGSILPGLGDAHVHITRQVAGMGTMLATDGLVPWVRSGITLLRDVGTAPIAFPSVAQFVDSLRKEGKAPRVAWAGPLITTVGGYPLTRARYAVSGQEIASAEEGRQLVEHLADGGAKVIKLALEHGYYRDEGWPILSLDEVKAITETAHQRGLLVTAHVTSLDEVRLALDGGVDNLAHTPLEPLPDDMIQEMLRKGMGMVTTASIWAPDFSDKAAANAKRYMDAGGLVALGTDFGCCDQPPGIEALLQEMEFLLRNGFTPRQLIVAATRSVALVSNLGDQVGTIQAAKIADIIVVEGDPLVNIETLRNVRTVSLGGRLVFERTP